MRLIDADRLKRQVEGRSWRAKEKFIELIEASATIKSQTVQVSFGVKHGRWVPVTNGRGGFECSICHSYAPSYQDGAEWLSLYCPNCGAKMDLEGEPHEQN